MEGTGGRIGRRALLAGAGALAVMPGAARAEVAEFAFTGLAGEPLAFADWQGHPVLVTNAASLCGFTAQYADLQAVHDRFAGQGLVVLAVPSDDFNQELGSNAEVADFCSTVFGLTIPITVITPVRGPQAHPFYRWLAQRHAIVPVWNFHKVLIGPHGDLRGHWSAATRPVARPVIRAIEAALRS
jgi:glutathione peroxidase